MERAPEHTTQDRKGKSGKIRKRKRGKQEIRKIRMCDDLSRQVRLSNGEYPFISPSMHRGSSFDLVSLWTRPSCFFHSFHSQVMEFLRFNGDLVFSLGLAREPLALPLGLWPNQWKTCNVLA
jgi:hypothetical protein